MTAGVVLRCDGTPADRPGMSLERCRAFLPTTALSPDEARHFYGMPGGWTQQWALVPDAVPTRYRAQDFCPACSRSHPTGMLA